MKNFTVVLIFSMGLTMLLFTNCGGTPGGFSTAVQSSADTNGSVNAGSTNGSANGATNGSTNGGSTSGNGFTVDRLTESEITVLVNDFIPQVGLVAKPDNRYSTSLFGIAREMISFPTLKYAYQRVNVSTSYLKNTGYPVQIRKSSYVKAPLAIILNPLYSGDTAGQMNRLMDFFASKNYHVMSIANTWSPEVISASPNFFPGDLWKEAPMHLELINKVVNNEFGGRGNINGATLIGMSYGAFMSSIVKAYDQQSGTPLVTGPTVMLSPPFDMISSLKTIDKQVAAISSADAISCALGGGFVNFMNSARSVTDYNRTNLDEKCSKWLFTSVGFYSTLLGSVAAISYYKGLNLSSSVMATITYEKYMNNVAKIAPAANQSDLGYWLAVSKNLGYDKFTVVASVDDNINEGKNLSTNAYYNFNSTALVLLPTGGHTGFREAKSRNKTCGKDWTECFLKAFYK